MLDAVDNITPVIPVEGHPVDKDRRRTLASPEERNTSGFDVGVATGRMKGRNIHGASVYSTGKALSPGIRELRDSDIVKNGADTRYGTTKQKITTVHVSLVPPFGAEGRLDELSAPRCHDLAQLGGVLDCPDAPQRSRGATEKASKAL